jgi:hypothetical protein
MDLRRKREDVGSFSHDKNEVFIAQKNLPSLLFVSMLCFVLKQESNSEMNTDF